ncbi:MAG: STAS domain-containing protein [Ignavibacteria bacterium]|nr:STAS domain-containing protein [Ignavibacteria bacterium]
MALIIKIRKFKNRPVIKLIGRVIGVDSLRFNKKMEALVNKNDKSIIIDISETQFIDSYGLGSIVYFNTFMQRSGREIIFYNKNPNPLGFISRLFEATKLNYVFRVIHSLDLL